MRRQTVPNPSTPGGLRPVEVITDRAKRYRARRNAPPKDRCYLCGNPDANDVEHIDGTEEHNQPANLAWSCRPCNALKGHSFARQNAGKKTAQRNPSTRRNSSNQGAKSLGAYLTGIMVLRGQSDAMQLQDAIALIHNTPQADRSRFAKDIWSRRKRSLAEVPF